jgi:hypothetical protein
MPPSKGSKLIVRSNGQNIEDIFTSPPPQHASSSSSSKSGGVKAANSSVTKGASGGGEVLALTPRSAEACLMEGIDPKDLYERALESFGDGANLDPAIIRMVSTLVLIACSNFNFESIVNPNHFFFLFSLFSLSYFCFTIISSACHAFYISSNSSSTTCP